MTQFLGVRGLAAAAALLLSFAAGPTAAFAKDMASIPKLQNFNLATPVSPAPLSTSPIVAAPAPDTQLPKVQALLRATMNGETLPEPTPIAKRSGPMVVMQAAPGSLLYDGVIGSAGDQSLAAMVDATIAEELDEEANCLATAVYFESKGEPLVGQLAVAQVVINRSRSGRYPPTLCAVVKQRAQFSFVRAGAFPYIDSDCAAWRRARIIARIAQNQRVASLPSDVLWYHADYVAPRWRSALVKVEKIGAHIFYRA